MQYQVQLKEKLIYNIFTEIIADDLLVTKFV